MIYPKRSIKTLGLVSLAAAALVAVLFAGTTPGSLSFIVQPLLLPNGSSEPEISIASNGVMGIVSLNWLIFGTSLWTGPFGTAIPQGTIDGALVHPGKRVFGGGDADVDMGSTGTMHVTTALFFVNPALKAFQIGVWAFSCPNAATSFNSSTCTNQFIDTTGVDRPWITSDGRHVWIAYHDAGNSALVRVKRSDDDGVTFSPAGDPIVGQGNATGDATFNNIEGPIVADSFTHNVYDIYAAGQKGIQKAHTGNLDHIFVSRSLDEGKSWTAASVFQSAAPAQLDNVFPALAVDPTNGKLYAVWSDAKTVSFSVSSDLGKTWSAAVAVNAAPANTAVLPWVAARNGTVDVVYYGTNASSKDDPSAMWNVYLAQTTNGGASFQQSQVNSVANHVGPICTNGTACAPGTRNLLDLFKVAINPVNGKAAIIYTDDTITTDSTGAPLPQAVLATQN